MLSEIYSHHTLDNSCIILTYLLHCFFLHDVAQNKKVQKLLYIFTELYMIAALQYNTSVWNAIEQVSYGA